MYLNRQEYTLKEIIRKTLKMRIILLAFTYLLLIVQHTEAQDKELIHISQDYISSFVKTKNAKAEISNEKSILIEMDKQNPLVELYAPEEKWDLSNNTSISFNVSNVGDTDIALNCHIGDHQWCEGYLLLSPGESGIMSVLIKGYKLPEKHALSLLYKDMRGLPGGYVWHWTPLVILLCYAGLRAIPEAYYQAAKIDGASRWAVFRYIQLPKMRGVLMIAVLLRFMDSFMIYTEPFVLTGGGPGNSTTFLSQFLTRMAIGQFDLGPAAAFSLIYFLIILLFSFIFYTALSNIEKGEA